MPGLDEQPLQFGLAGVAASDYAKRVSEAADRVGSFPRLDLSRDVGQWNAATAAVERYLRSVADANAVLRGSSIEGRAALTAARAASSSQPTVDVGGVTVPLNVDVGELGRAVVTEFRPEARRLIDQRLSEVLAATGGVV
ncbi:MAG: hypothetical protein AAF561_05490 [Planctomycetota bacterium]